MPRRILPLVGLLAIAPMLAIAQSAEDAPPPVLVIGHESLKPGRASAHEKVSMGYTALFAKVNPEESWLGLVPMSGEDGAFIYIQAYPSFAAAAASHEKVVAAMAQNAAWSAEMDRLDAQNAELRTSSRTSWLVYRPALSYHPPKLGDVAKARIARITTYHIKPGHTPDWIDYIKSLNVARDKASASWINAAVYESTAGLPAGTFLVFQFNRSLGELDEINAKADDRQKAIDTALGGEQIVKMRRDLISGVLADAAATTIYEINKAESKATPAFAAADPDFWSPKPAAAAGKALATKKEVAPPKP
jgi:hypothetical protein